MLDSIYIFIIIIIIVSPLLKPEEISKWLDIPTLYMHYKHDWSKPGTQFNHLQALIEYFIYKDLSISYNVLNAEAKFLCRIFPYYQASYIIKLLGEIGNEPNRIRVVARKLCLKVQKKSIGGSGRSRPVNKNTLNNNRHLLPDNPELPLTQKRIFEQNECSESDLFVKKSKSDCNENIKKNNLTVNNFELKKAIEDAVSKIDQKSEVYFPEIVKSISEIQLPKRKDSPPQQNHSLISTENKTEEKDSLNSLSSKSNNSNLNQSVHYPQHAYSEQIETVTSTTMFNKQEVQNTNVEVNSSERLSISALLSETYQSPFDIFSEELQNQNCSLIMDKFTQHIISSDGKEDFDIPPIQTGALNNRNAPFIIVPSTSKENFVPSFSRMPDKYVDNSISINSNSPDLLNNITSHCYDTFPTSKTSINMEWLAEMNDCAPKIEDNLNTESENKNVPLIIVPSTSKENFVPSFSGMPDKNMNNSIPIPSNSHDLLDNITNKSFDNFPISKTPINMEWLSEINGFPKIEDNLNTVHTTFNKPSRNTKDTPKIVQLTPVQCKVNIPRIMEKFNAKISNSPIDLTVDAEEEDVQLMPVPTKETETNPLIYQLLEIFPEACPDYLRKICKNRTIKLSEIDSLISEILSSDYPKRKIVEEEPKEIDANELSEHLKELLPNADPTYLEMKAEQLANKPDDLKVFISNAFERHDYPTMKEYLRRVKISSQQKQYTTNFTVENFLDVIPDPFTYFKDSSRKSNVKDDGQDIRYVIAFLKNKYPQVPVKIISSMDILKNNLIKICQLLDKAMPMKSKRKPVPLPKLLENIPLLQEIAFIHHEEEIHSFIKVQKAKEEQEREIAKQAGLLQTCQCCFDDEVMPKDIAHCNSGCVFCKSCVSKSIEVAFGEGKLQFPCLSTCTSEFSLQTLQNVLNPKIFSKIALKKQVEEVKAAGIEDIESCPFCDFVSIPAKEDKLFRCLNPSCMKESCRECKEPSHVPLRCEEVEKDEDVKARIYIENKMAEALIRKCYKCGLKFVKSDGCNKMTCSCGATMCYICNNPVIDYKHFNGQGGTNFELCPLYSDTDKLHVENILKSANEAKAELGKENLKIDPTADLQKHYKIKNRRKSNNVPPHVDPFVVMNEAERILQVNYIVIYNTSIHPKIILNCIVK
ncbi:uncharacterized protein LOC108735577 isoform X2 [Agrilus planipennis]|uniref:Uncharacterized protein LOC108735577 isoform X2 n=1 Tax=Agrilus planipennis TaxID=224129 RepID=A0A7F5R5Y3_AGRPL|nr:uncharacterized protein LOC108735577 isoform X2 [Agrilus planipennis]